MLVLSQYYGLNCFLADWGVSLPTIGWSDRLGCVATTYSEEQSADFHSLLLGFDLQETLQTLGAINLQPVFNNIRVVANRFC